MKKIILIILAILFFGAGALAQDKAVVVPSPEKLKDILASLEQYTQKTMKDWNIPGLAIGVVQGDKLIYAKGFGVKTLGGNDDPVTPNTLFQIGSTSKAFATTAMAMLQDEGKFKWEDKVINYAPDFMMYDPWATREFQVAELMEQHSGMPGYSLDTLLFLGFGPRYIMEAVRYVKPISSFRSQYAYQNCLFFTVAGLIEKFSGQTWDKFVAERIFKPLGMSSSSTDMQSFLKAKDVSSLHAKVNKKIKSLPKNWKYLSWSYDAGPAGAINSNIIDMAKWISFQMNSAKLNGKELVTEKNMLFLRSPKTIFEPIDTGGGMYYCLGWIYKEFKPYPVIWHNGGTTSMKTMVAFVPDAKIGIVILSNHITGLPELLAFRFLEEYFARAPEDYSAKLLDETTKEEREAEAKRPVPPKTVCAPMPLERYAGDYVNDVYGKVNVSLAQGKLILSVGPKSVLMRLKHWDKDSFVVVWDIFGEEEGAGFAKFEVGPDGAVAGLSVDILNKEGCGIFKRVVKESAGNKS